MKYSSRFFLYAPFAGLLFLAAIAGVNWWVKASAMAERLDAMNGHEIMPGVRIHFDAKTIGGFPFRLDTVLKNLRIDVADTSGPVTWTTEGFAMHVLTYGQVQAILEAGGRQTLSWRDGRGAGHRFAFLPGTFRASAILQNGKLLRFDSEIVDLDGDAFRAAQAQLHLRARAEAIDLYLSLAGAHLDGGYAAALGSDISQLIADATLDRAGALDPLLRGDRAPDAALEGWRQAGGRFTVKKLTVARGKQSQSYAGQLTLDDAHDLSGTISATNGVSLRFKGNRIERASALP